jgi:sterol-4alpha-carboxylate 3-dehydrogenase (decarboxylating)
VRQFTSSSVPYAAVTLFIKLSILLLYRRVFAIMAKTGRLFHYGTIFGIIIVTILHIPYIATQIYTVIYCETPESLIQNQFCSHLYGLNISQSTINVVTDLYIFILPLPRLLELKLPPQRKVGVFVVFAGGLVACVVSIVRLVLMAKTLSLEDSTWNTALTMELS